MDYSNFNDISSLKLQEQALIKQNKEILALDLELQQEVKEINLYSELVKTSKERLNRAQALAHVGNWELDLESSIIWASEEAIRIYGLGSSASCFPLKDIRNLAILIDRPRLKAALEMLIKTIKSMI